MKYLESFKEGHILEIALDRPDKANALNLPLIQSLATALRSAGEDADVRVILLTGRGKFFCAGGDLEEMEKREGMFAGDSSQIVESYRKGIQKIPRILESLSIPVVAAINGAAVGAGLDLATMCDIRLASSRARFGETFCKLGLISGDGGAFFLPRVVGYAKAMEMTLTGKLYGASEAMEMGLVSCVVEPEKLMDRAREMCQSIAAHPPLAVKMAKRALKLAGNLEQTLELASSHQAISHGTQEHRNALESLKRPSRTV